MNITPIQVTEEGVLIPRHYLPDATEFELLVAGDYVFVRPKSNGSPVENVQKGWPYDWIGIAETRDPTASSHVEEILRSEIDRRAGWTQDSSTED